MSEMPLSAKQLWPVLTQLPDVGVSMLDRQGNLLFVNDVAMEMFFPDPTVAYAGKSIADFHSKEFVEERLRLIALVLDDNQPIRFRHIYKARRLESKIWPLHALPGNEEESSDSVTHADRVLVVTSTMPAELLPVPASADQSPHAGTEELILESEAIDLGHLNVLSPRELEVLVLLGHGESVPEVAKRLYRSPKTIERHKTAIGHKLHLSGQAEISRLVTQVGLDLSHVALRRLNESSPE